MARLIQLNREEWSVQTEGYRDYSYRQTWDYGVLLAEKRRARCEHVAVREEDLTLGHAGVRVKPVPVLGGGLAFISFGPLCQNQQDDQPDSLNRILPLLEEEYVSRRRFNLRIQPPLRWGSEAEGLHDLYRSRGYVIPKEHRPYRTFLLDLSPPVETIRSSLTRRWRRHLNQAERERIEVEVSTAPEAMQKLIGFHQDFAFRKGFRTELDAAFYSRVQSRLPEAKRFLVFLAWVEGRLAAGAVMSLLGDTMVYLLGGRNDLGSQTRASYLLHWRAIEAAKERGFRWYDLGGTDPMINPGVHTFKEGVGGMELTAPGPYELPSGSHRATLLRTLERIYRLNRRIGVV